MSTATSARSRARARTGARFLDPLVLSRIDNLELLARTVVDGFLTGLHRSPHLGFSLDFAEHRQYMAGDDVRRIDWKLFARTDRHYIKLFEADTNANMVVLLDVSRSMAYGSHGVTKLDYGRYLAASLTFLSHRQRDRVGLATFDASIVAYVPPAMKHLDTVLHVLDRAASSSAVEAGPTPTVRLGHRGGSAEAPPGSGIAATSGMAAPLAQLADVLRRRGILVLVSDFYGDPDEILAAVEPLVACGHDVLVQHVLDPAELEFPFEDATAFEDMESGRQIPVIPGRLREAYRALVRAHVSALEDRLTGIGADYTLLDTSRPLDLALFRYLSARERRSRTRARRRGRGGPLR